MADRRRPNDQQAEAALVGVCLNSARAFDDAIGTVTPDDFYKPHHGHIWAAMTALHLAGQPVDTVTVVDQMRRTGTLLPDTPQLLVDVLADAPASSGVRRHVEIVVNLSRARRLQTVAQEIVERCYDPAGGPEALIDWAQEQVYQVAQERRRTAETVTLATAVDQWMTMLEETAAGTRSPGLPTGLADLDRHLGGLRGGQLITAAGRPAMGKSLLGSQVAVHVAAAGIPVLLVSVEMSLPELVGRMVGAESQVGLTHLRSGRIPDKSWPHISTATSKLSGLPLYLLDDSGATITTVRTQGRRLKGRTGLGLIVVDYLQLMSSTTRRDNRAVEVGELSGGLKRIARDLDVPVIALAQLNRGVEYRQDKRPTLADLRECLTGDTVMSDPLTGEQSTILDLHKRGEKVNVLALNEDWRLEAAVSYPVVEAGMKPVYRLKTSSGREIRASANHPFRTLAGWKELGNLEVGDPIAVPRRYKVAGDPGHLNEDLARLLGYLISDGHYGHHRSVGFTNNDPTVMADAVAIAARHFGITARTHPHWSGTPCVDFTVPGAGPGKNPMINWLKSLGIHGHLGPQKVIPAEVFKATSAIQAHLIGALWAGDGSVRDRKGHVALKYTSTSRALLKQVQHLLLRLDVRSTVTPPGRNTKSTMDIANVMIVGSQEVRAFSAVIPIIGRKGARMVRATEHALVARVHASDGIPNAIWPAISAARVADGRTWNQLERRCCQPTKNPSRADLQRFSELVGNVELQNLATSDVLWDQIISVIPDGEEMTYDLSVPGLHNFVANDIIVHNSGAIENDSDVVLGLYRDEYYNPGSPDTGTAEILVLKQRNGPAGVTAKVGYRPDIGVFTNLAGEERY